jgi:hypothetical protein
MLVSYSAICNLLRHKIQYLSCVLMLSRDVLKAKQRIRICLDI